MWGSDPKQLSKQNFDLFVIRSVWDYSISETHTINFFKWLKELEEHKVPVVNNYNVIYWNQDKHYLQELEQQGVKILPTEFLEPKDTG